jgi:23S rRNA pseudouridine1911/1915/1917 synthase
MDAVNTEYSLTNSKDIAYTEGGGLHPSRVLYEDERCLVINKIAGEALEGAGKGVISLPGLLSERFSGKGAFPPRAVHRLDVPVSGCALFARSAGALSFLSKAFVGAIGADKGADDNAGEGRVQKRYWAVLETPQTPVPDEGELVHWIEWNKRKNKSAAYSEEAPGRRKALLRYRIAGRGDRYLFMDIELLTGRRHQIRAQLEAVGLHIKGDLKYGAKRSEKGGGIRLHARGLGFPDPRGSPPPILVSAPPPFRDRLWEDFGKCYPEEHVW